MSTATIAVGDHVTVSGWRGVVFTITGEEWEQVVHDTWIDDPDDDDGGYWLTDIDERPTGQLLAVMVGDDRTHIVDPDDCTPYDDPVCSCGQVGCGWHGQEE